MLNIFGQNKLADLQDQSCDYDIVGCGNRPLVFVLPGVQGSILRSGSKTVWPSPVRLAFGGIRNIDAESIRSEGLLPRRYGALLCHLRRTHDVVEFHYDWRNSLVEQAERLNRAVSAILDTTPCSTQPIHFLGHSMGGLVARMLMAHHRDTWDRVLARNEQSRLLMLGTPNAGSLSVVLGMIGRDPLIRLLQATDVRGGAQDVLNKITQMQSLLEMLPTGRSGKCFTPAFWDDLAKVAPRGWKPPTRQALADAWAVRNSLSLTAQDTRNMVYIAGQARKTPVSIEVVRHRGKWTTCVKVTRAGDGRVPWQTGQLIGVPTWYAPNAKHRTIPKDCRVFPAITDLLVTGQTDQLSRRPPVAHSDAAVLEHSTFDLASKATAAVCRIKGRYRSFSNALAIPS